MKYKRNLWLIFTLRYYGMFLWFPELFSRIEKYGGSPCSLGKVNDTNTNSTIDCVYDTSAKIYYESFLTASSNLPGNIFTILMIDKIGRKIMLGTFHVSPFFRCLSLDPIRNVQV